MSDLSDALASALGAVSSFKGDTIGYRTSNSGSFTTLTGFVFHKDRVPVANFDDQGRAEVVAMTAYLKGPLTPAMVKGYQIQIGGSSSDIWSVDSVMVDGQQICLCRRQQVQSLGPNRGATR